MSGKFAVLLLVAGGSLFAEPHFSVFIGGAPVRPYGYYQGQDLREDYRDVAHDYAQVDRLRADIARDRYELQEAWENGDEWQASRIAGDLARDQRALDAVLADIARDRRDIHRDEGETYRGWGYPWWR